MTQIIRLGTSGKGRPAKNIGAALVDDADHDWLSQWNWCLIHPDRAGGGYAARSEPGIGGHTMILMHRLIMGAGPGAEVDHINGNTLDNRRENLRIVTLTQNRQNRRVHKNNKSGYKGVVAHGNVWCARVQVQCPTAEDAARMYDRLAHVAFGEFAKTNF